MSDVIIKATYMTGTLGLDPVTGKGYAKHQTVWTQEEWDALTDTEIAIAVGPHTTALEDELADDLLRRKGHKMSDKILLPNEIPPAQIFREMTREEYDAAQRMLIQGANQSGQDYRALMNANRNGDYWPGTAPGPTKEPRKMLTTNWILPLIGAIIGGCVVYFWSALH